MTTSHLSAHSPRPALGALSESPLTPRSGVSEDAVRAWSEGEWCEKGVTAPGTFLEQGAVGECVVWWFYT